MTEKRGRGRPKKIKVENSQPIQNGLSDALGVPGIGFPQNQGSPFTEQISNVTTGFKNLRWYLVSNFRQFLSQAYVELGLVQTIVDVPVDDGLRGGVEIKSKQLSEEQIGELLVSLDRDDDLNTVAQAAKWNRLFGGAGVLILTDQDPEEPLDIDAITKDSDLEFRAVDMWELFWDKQNTEGYDPAIQSENFTYYNYYGEQVHKSRVMRLKGITAPSFIRPRLRGWGFSVVETLIRSINQYLKATDLAFEVLDEFKVDVFKVKNLVNTLLSPNGEQKIRQRVQLANYQKNYQNALTMDSEDDWDHKQLSFAGLGDAMKEIRMQVASDMRMPLTKLFGISAAGFNSGEDDIEVYNAMVESQVRNKLKYDILRICEIKCQKLFGYIPDDLSVSFKPLRILSAEQEENVKTQKFNRLLAAKTAGEIDTKEFRDAINKGNLFDISLDNDFIDDDGGYMDDTVKEGANDPKDPKDVDDPGADRLDTQKALGSEKGGISKEPPAPKSSDSPNVKAQTPDPKKKEMKNDSSWDESKHPRAKDGKFGEGGSSKTTPEKSSKMREFKTKHPAMSGYEYQGEGDRESATKKAREMREAGVFASIFHIDGPRTGPKSKYFVMAPEGKDGGGGDGGKGGSSGGNLTASSEKIKLAESTSDETSKDVLKKTQPIFDSIKKSKPELSEAIEDWSNSGYLYARSIQQGKSMDNEDRRWGYKILKNMDKHFSDLPKYEGPLVRDLNLELDESKMMFKEGEEFTLDAHSSFTARDRYLTRRKVRLIVQNSSAGRSVWGLSKNDDEMEVIVPKGQKYKVEKVEESDEAPYLKIFIKEVA